MKATTVTNSTFTHTPTTLQLLRYSAITWNAHRIHYATAYAEHEGHPGLLVHSHLRAALAQRALDEWVEQPYRLTEFSYRLLRPATPGTALTYHCAFTSNDKGSATIEVKETMVDGSVGFSGIATIQYLEVEA